MASDVLQGDLLAEETHSGRIWSLLVLPALIAPAISIAFYPTAPARYALVVVAVIGIGALALMFSGFQYRFLRHGVQVRTLGFTLRTIPKQSIVSYSVEPWSLMRGYGIRAKGNTRAYVWGNKVVHIQTTNGEVFLGHKDPDQIVRDLDRMTGLGRSGLSYQAQLSGDDVLPGDSEEQDKNRGGYTIAIWLMWLALPITALNYWQAWDHLPARMAVHFDANWKPTGYTSREGALTLGLGIMAVMLVIFTVGGFVLRTAKSSPAWPMLAFFYLVLGFVCYANYSIVRFNLHLLAPHPPPVNLNIPE